MEPLGKTLVGLGLGLAAVGALILFGERLGALRFGRLPGDIAYEKNGFGVYVPITSMLLLSGVVSFAIWLFGRWRR